MYVVSVCGMHVCNMSVMSHVGMGCLRGVRCVYFVMSGMNVVYGIWCVPSACSFLCDLCVHGRGGMYCICVMCFLCVMCFVYMWHVLVGVVFVHACVRCVCCVVCE